MRAALLLLPVAMLATAGPAAAGGAEDAVRAFLRAFDTKDSSVRRKAVGLLEEVPGPAATEALLPALADEAPAVRERAREVLRRRVEDADLAVLARAGLRSPRAEVRRRCADALADAGARAAPHAEALGALLRDRDPLVREAAAAALGVAGHRGPAPVVAAAYRRETVPEVRGSLLLALGVLDPESARPEAARAVRERDGPTVVAALRVLARLDAAAAARAADPALVHPAWEARLEAAALIAAHGSDASSVDALLGALRREKRRRVRAALGEALERITGAPFGSDADRWEEWWRKRREGWSPGRVAPPEAPPPGRRGESTARFYDIPIDGDRVVFVLDVSKSMGDPARLGQEATKIQIVATEFARTLAFLREDTSFNLVAFATEVDAWRPRVAAATPTAKYEALRFLQSRPTGGWTCVYDALAAALADAETDIVFLLSDGAPTRGEETTRTGILRAVARLRRWRPVRIHCIEIGAQNTGARWKGFLAELAAATGGVHVSR